MKTVIDILKKAGGWHPGLYLKIDNPPHPTLVIDAMDESGPCGLPALSVAQYIDALAHPEMFFELGNAGGVHLNPFYYRNDYRGEEEWSRFVHQDHYSYDPQLHTRHEGFARTWNETLRSQHFAEVFTDKCIVR
jgi:hypothetical protein